MEKFTEEITDKIAKIYRESYLFTTKNCMRLSDFKHPVQDYKKVAGPLAPIQTQRAVLCLQCM